MDCRHWRADSPSPHFILALEVFQVASSEPDGAHMKALPSNRSLKPSLVLFNVVENPRYLTMPVCLSPTTLQFENGLWPIPNQSIITLPRYFFDAPRRRAHVPARGSDMQGRCTAPVLIVFSITSRRGALCSFLYCVSNG